jgi:DNA polymerase I-like protein with 3'-5' exonuclease and polymerase domains
MKNATVTGRTRIVPKPNFQNIPVHTALGRELRKAIEQLNKKKGS